MDGRQRGSTTEPQEHHGPSALSMVFLLVVTILFQAADAFENAASELTLNPALAVTDVARVWRTQAKVFSVYS